MIRNNNDDNNETHISNDELIMITYCYDLHIRYKNKSLTHHKWHIL